VKTASDIIQLRQALAERFPSVRAWTEETAVGARARDFWPTGVVELDALLLGGFPKGVVTEMVSAKTGAGSASLLRALLRQARHSRQPVALIDGVDSFDPAGLPPAALSRLLWVRCRNVEEAMKAADIVLRDRNLPIVVLDLKMNPSAQLRKISATSWYRLQRLAQAGGAVLAVLTPVASAPCADARVTLESDLALTDLGRDETEIAARLKFDLTRWALGAHPAIVASAAEAG
jgi:hypothetical protein